MNDMPSQAVVERNTLVGMLLPLKPFLDRTDLFEIVVNQPGEVWTESADGWQRHDVPALDFAYLSGLARVIATFTQQSISEARPVLSAVLPGDERVQVLIPPAVTKGTVSLTIRKPSRVMFTLEELHEQGLFDQTRLVGSGFGRVGRDVTGLESVERVLVETLHYRRYVNFLRLAVKNRKNILISGGTGSGKTTLSKSLITEIDTDERILTIEDTQELLIRQANHVRLFYSKGGQGQAQVTAQELLAATMRMRPDRILLQEIRDGTAFDYIQNVSAGHPGTITTIHSNSASHAFQRMRLLVKQSEAGRGLEGPEVLDLLRMLVDVVIQTKRTGGKFQVTEIYFDPWASLVDDS